MQHNSKLKFNSAILLLLLIIIPALPLLTGGFPITHDGMAHLLRIAHLKRSIAEGQLLPGWLGFLDFTYGSPVLLYNWLLPYYLVLLITALGISVLTAMKTIYVLSLIASATFFYLFVKAYVSDNSAKIGALIYVWSPYYFYNIYERGALGEAVALTFAPFIFYCFKRSEKQWSLSAFWLCLIGLCLIILSHQAIAFLTILLLFGWELIQAQITHSIIQLKYLVMILISALLITSWFWIPRAIEISATHSLEIAGTMYASQLYSPLMSQNLLQFLDVLNKNIALAEHISVFTTNLFFIFYLIAFFIISIGMTQMLGIIIGLVFKFSSPMIKTSARYWSTIFFLSLYLTTYYSQSLWRILPLGWILYPWRFLGIATFAAAFLTALVIDNSAVKTYLKVLLLCSLVLQLPKLNQYLNGPRINPADALLFSSTSLTDKTGAYFPVWTKTQQLLDLNSSHFTRPSRNINENQNGELVEIKRTSFSAEYQSNSLETRPVTLNIFYFPGWQARVNNTEVKLQPNLDSSPAGLIKLILPAGRNKLKLMFTQTPLRIFCYAISIISLLLFITGSIIYKRIKFNTAKTHT